MEKKSSVYGVLIFLMVIQAFLLILVLIFPTLNDRVILIILLLVELGLIAFCFGYFKRSDYAIRKFMETGDRKYINNIRMPLLFRIKDVSNKMLEEEKSSSRYIASNREAQLLALQNQINPHFLYNTLETIRSDAMIQGVTSVATMTEALATFFRYTISNLDKLVRIEEELENVQNYYVIQHYRFGNKLQLRLDYDEQDFSLIKLYMPKLILQPLVENAIYHGIEQKLGAGIVTIKIENTKSQLQIIICDDGVGIGEDQLSLMNSALENGKEIIHSFEKKSSGIAIGNVNQRIKLLFGSAYGVYLRSIVNVGTEVHIVLPVITHQGEGEENV